MKEEQEGLMDGFRSPPLPHSPAPVFLSHLVEVESPYLAVVVGQGDPLVARDDVLVDGQDGLRVDPHPRNLEGARCYNNLVKSGGWGIVIHGGFFGFFSQLLKLLVGES